jgi:hypothetical protein
MPTLAMVSHDGTAQSQPHSTDHLTDPCCFDDGEFPTTISQYADGGPGPVIVPQPTNATVYFESLKDIDSAASSTTTSSDTSIDDDSQEQRSCSSQPLLLDEMALPSIRVGASSHHIDPTASKDVHPGSHASFLALRSTYLLVTLVIMLADGLQGKKATEVLEPACRVATGDLTPLVVQAHTCMFFMRAMVSRSHPFTASDLQQEGCYLLSLGR